jgi:transglutaminase/protease-like cytokinesis protein 3
MYGQYPGGMAPDQSQQPGGPPRTFMSIDLHAKSIKDNLFFNCETLARECTRTSKTDFERARALFTWISTHVGFDVNLLTVNATDLERLCDPEAIIQSRRTVPRGYALLYQRLCNLVGLTAVVIDGVCRYPSVFDTYTGSIRDCWNAVLVNGKFWFVDCCTCL